MLMATLADVSKEAKVSTSTVSRVMNGSKKISKETTRRVMDAARKVDYKPNIELEKEKVTTNTIGVIVSSYLSDPFYFPIFESVFETIEQLGYKMLFCRLNNIYDSQPNLDLLEEIEDKVDGIIFVGNFWFSDSQLKTFTHIKCPIVSLFGYIDAPMVSHVITNNFQAAYDATAYLIKIGHRRIAHIMANRSFSHSIERLDGYMAALSDNHIEVDQKLITVSQFSFHEAYQASISFIDNNINDFTAVFCFNDIIASAFINACKDRNLRVPEDVSVIGVDDLTYENLLISKDVFPITTMRQPRKEMADYAIRMLIQKLCGIEGVDRKVYNPILIERNTTISKGK
jgi:DNA-binding LacI/PurR family transcriptional regulator